MNWGSQYVLYWLLALLPLALILFTALKHRENRLNRIIYKDHRNTLAPTYNSNRNRGRLICWLAAIALVIIALARPQWGFRWEEVTHRGLDIMVVLDTSKSMLANDIKPNRLQQAKWGIRNLLERLEGDRIGLISFAGDAFLSCPLTSDQAAFKMNMEDVYCGIIPKGGTAIEVAIQKAIDSFEYDKKADKAIVLITDGEDHEGDPSRLLAKLKDKGIRLYAVGVGTPDGELIPATESNGATTAGYLKDQEGNVIKSSLQEDVLSNLALGSGGAYVRAVPGDFGLERIYDQRIDQLKRADMQSRHVQRFVDRYMWFLAGALLLLALEALMPRATRRSAALLLLIVLTFPRSSQAQSTPPAVSNETVTATMEEPESSASARTLMNAGIAVYELGSFDDASEFFIQAAAAADTAEIRNDLDPATAHFNAANALFQSQDYEAAEKEYTEALNSANISLQADAYYNQGNSIIERARSGQATNDYQSARTLFTEALDAYENAMLLDSESPDAKINYELTLSELEKMAMSVEQLGLLLYRVGQDLEQYKFENAAATMQRELPGCEMALSLEPELKKKSEGLQQRINEIVGIIQQTTHVNPTGAQINPMLANPPTTINTPAQP